MFSLVLEGDDGPGRNRHRLRPRIADVVFGADAASMYLSANPGSKVSCRSGTLPRLTATSRRVAHCASSHTYQSIIDSSSRPPRFNAYVTAILPSAGTPSAGLRVKVGGSMYFGLDVNVRSDIETVGGRGVYADPCGMISFVLAGDQDGIAGDGTQSDQLRIGGPMKRGSRFAVGLNRCRESCTGVPGANRRIARRLVVGEGIASRGGGGWARGPRCRRRAVIPQTVSGDCHQRHAEDVAAIALIFLAHAGRIPVVDFAVWCGPQHVPWVESPRLLRGHLARKRKCVRAHNAVVNYRGFSAGIFGLVSERVNILPHRPPSTPSTPRAICGVFTGMVQWMSATGLRNPL